MDIGKLADMVEVLKYLLIEGVGDEAHVRLFLPFVYSAFQPALIWARTAFTLSTTN